MTRGAGIEIKFSEDWFGQILRGDPSAKGQMLNALRGGMKKAGKGMQRDFVSKLHSGKLKKRTGDLEKSFLKPGALAVTGTKIDNLKIVFGSDSPTAMALETGATVTPKRGQWLAWPSSLAKRQQLPGKTPARDFFQRHGKNALFKAPGEKGAYGGIFLKIGKNRLEKWFNVARQTKVPRRLWFERRTNRYWQDKGMDIVHKEMMRLVGE
jgi:hypothetical protein